MALIEKDVKTIEELKTVIGHGGKAAVLYDATTGEPYGLDMEVLINMDTSIGGKAENTVQITAGAGLTGGGTLESDRTLNVVSANDGITVNADNIQLNAVDNLASTSATQPLSANQGRLLDAAKEAVSNKKQILTDSETDYPSGRAVYEPMVNTEHAIADIVAHLEGRIKTLEKLLTASAYNKIQVNELSVVKNIKLKGADTKLFGTGAPIITPDFAGQEYLDQTAKIWYDAVGVVNAGDWKPRTNA